MYASPTTVSGAFTPRRSRPRSRARATRRSCGGGARGPTRQAGGLDGLRLVGGSGGGRVERAPVHMSFVAERRERRAQAGARSSSAAREAAGVAKDNSVSVTRAVTAPRSEFWSVHAVPRPRTSRILYNPPVRWLAVVVWTSPARCSWIYGLSSSSGQSIGDWHKNALNSIRNETSRNAGSTSKTPEKRAFPLAPSQAPRGGRGFTQRPAACGARLATDGRLGAEARACDDPGNAAANASARPAYTSRGAREPSAAWVKRDTSRPSIQIWRQGVLARGRSAAAAPRSRPAAVPGRASATPVNRCAVDARRRRAQPNTGGGPAAPAASSPPEEEPPQSTQPETAEDGQTLFDDELDRLLPVGTASRPMRAAPPARSQDRTRCARSGSGLRVRICRVCRVRGVGCTTPRRVGGAPRPSSSDPRSRDGVGTNLTQDYDRTRRRGRGRAARLRPPAAPLEAFWLLASRRAPRREQG